MGKVQSVSAGQNQLASCSRRPCLQNKLQIGGYLLQLARPCWSPGSLTPFFWRSGAHISWQANYWQPLRFGEEPRRELSISCGHPGTLHPAPTAPGK